MLIEHSSHANPLRHLAPSAKGLFAVSGMVAVYLATTPLASLAVASLFVFLTLGVATVAVRSYLLIFAPALLFIALGSLAMTFSFAFGNSWHDIELQFLPAEVARAATVCSRSLGSLSALLFLTMTTPVSDLIALLRRLRTPALLIDIMVLGYRSLFVFNQVLDDTRTAQASRLGYRSMGQSLRALGILMAHTTVQLWDRSRQLHTAALARAGGEKALHFADQNVTHDRLQCLIALIAGIILNLFVVISP